MQIRFSARMVEKLCDSVRTEVDNIRQIERKIQDLVVQQGRHAAAGVHQEVPEPRDVSLRWIDREIAAHHFVQRIARASTGRRSSSSSRSSRPAGSA